jgi:hypothetical protein
VLFVENKMIMIDFIELMPAFTQEQVTNFLGLADHRVVEFYNFIQD